MRVLHVIESLGRGGAEQALVNLLPVLQGRGCDAEVAALWPPYTLRADLENKGIRVHGLDVAYRWNAASACRRLGEVIRRGHFDLIHAHLFFASVYSALARSQPNFGRCIVSLHNVDYEAYPAVTPWKKLRKSLHLHLLRKRVDGYVAVSHAVAEHYQAEIGGLQLPVIHNAFPVDQLKRQCSSNHQAVRSRYGVRSDEFMIIVPGRWVPEKGHTFLLEALAILRARSVSPRTVIVGEGPLAQDLRRQVDDLGLRDQVRLEPALPHAELMALVGAADLFVTSAIFEGFPLAPAEAMALETPVLAARAGGLAELIDHGHSGWLVPSCNSIVLAEAIELLMNDPELRTLLGRSGRVRIVEQFSTRVIAERWVEYYTNMLQISTQHPEECEYDLPCG
jgi:glycosyltransferase involved in cell wall biosynthesis